VGRAVELIVVDDGSTDRTVEVAEEHLEGVPLTRVLRLPWHAGKGAAVRLGVAAAHGDRIVFMDADLATDLDALPVLIDALDHAHVVVGTRAAAGAVVSGRTPARHLLHRAFSMHARLAGVQVSDPQCGFKGFRTDAAKLLFHLATIDGFGFDVEILLLARKLGLSVSEVPVRWQAIQGSKVKVLRDPAAMVIDVARARLRHHRKPSVETAPLPTS
jgi:glycosyltransferase involved in cell wall biosynthesis